MKCLKNYGVAVQKSVFEACLYDDDKLRMTEEAKAFIAENDSLRIYVLSKKAYKEKEVTGIPFDYRPEEDVIL
jgi:CRISPR-associated protein Cas2